MKDIYIYNDCDVLINKFGYKDQSLLEQCEADWVSLRLREVVEKPFLGNYDLEHFYEMHRYLFQDVYDWAGQPRKINMIKEEPILGGLSIEYSDVFDINTDASTFINKLSSTDWNNMTKAEIVENFSDILANLWKIHCFREGNTRTTVTFCCQFADEFIHNINRKLLEENSAYLRTALVAYCAFFSDGTNCRKKEYLFRIIEDAFGFRE